MVSIHSSGRPRKSRRCRPQSVGRATGTAGGRCEQRLFLSRWPARGPNPAGELAVVDAVREFSFRQAGGCTRSCIQAGPVRVAVGGSPAGEAGRAVVGGRRETTGSG